MILQDEAFFLCSQINFNLILMIVLEVLMASTVILSARSAEDCCCHRKVSVRVSICFCFYSISSHFYHHLTDVRQTCDHKACRVPHPTP